MNSFFLSKGCLSLIIILWVFYFPVTIPPWLPCSMCSSCNQVSPEQHSQQGKCFYPRGHMASRQRWAQSAFLLTTNFKWPWKSLWCYHSGQRFGFVHLSTSLLCDLQSPDAMEKSAGSACSFPFLSSLFPKQLADANKLLNTWWDTSWPLHGVGTCLSSFL